MMGKKSAAWIRRAVIAGVLFFCGIVAMPEVGKAAGDNAAYELQKASDLLQKGQFKVSGGKIKLTEDEKAGGVMLGEMPRIIPVQCFRLVILLFLDRKGRIIW